MKSVENIRKEVKKMSKMSGRKKYPRAVVESCLSLLGRYSIVELSQATGISHQTIRTWNQQSGRKPGVKIHRWPKSTEKTLKLHFPDGRWIEGLSLSDIKELDVDAISKKGA